MAKKAIKIVSIVLGAVIIGAIIIGVIFNTGNKEERVINKLDITELARPHWSSQDLENAQIALDFVQKIMNDHDFDYIRTAYKNSSYKQHNRGMADGIDGVISYLEDFTDQYPNFSYDVKHIYVDGPYVTLHSHGTMSVADRGNPDKGLNIYDTWKVENGMLVEHWDSMQGIDGGVRFFGFLTGGAVKNDNTLF